MTDCIFCDITSGKIPNMEFLIETDDLVVFKDINPKAAIHFLIVPKKHIATINDLHDNDDTELAGKMIQAAKQAAKQLNIADDGYRLLFNCNKNGGQEVYHIHLHLLGGERLAGMNSRARN